MLGARIVLAVATVNLTFLFLELGFNVIMSFYG